MDDELASGSHLFDMPTSRPLELDSLLHDDREDWLRGATLNNGIGSTEVEHAQRAFCNERAASYVASLGEAKSGFAISTFGKTPINGLRHPAKGGATGWYIWCGEQASDALDFYVPIHTSHLYEQYPEIAKLLGLEPGYRFLLASDYLDIWFDASLLHV